MAEVELRNVSKVYKDTVAVDDVSLHIRDREFVALLGPSCSRDSSDPTAGRSSSTGMT